MTPFTGYPGELVLSEDMTILLALSLMVVLLGMVGWFSYRIKWHERREIRKLDRAIDKLMDRGRDYRW